MISKRLIANLIAFFLISALLVGYGVVNLLGNPLRSPMVLTADFPDASGLYQNFPVELNGVPVGTVAGTSLTARGTRVTMDIHPGNRIPGDVQASIQIANDLGEQVVDLLPAHGGTAAPLRTGDRVPVASNEVPANVGQVVETATKLLQAIPAGDLNTLIGELATSLKGRAGDLRTIISAGTTFSQEFVAYEQQFTELLANAPTALDTITAVAPQLRQDLVNTSALLQVLAEQKQGLDTLFNQGSTAVSQVDQLVSTQSANLGCIFHDAADTLSNLAESQNLTDLSQGLTYNEDFFNAVSSVAQPGLAPATTSQTAAQPDQLFLRTRLLIPPVLSPAAEAYSSTSPIPDILPGAGCVTADGSGVGPATQAGFVPTDGGQVVAPTAAEADIAPAGGSTLPTSTTAYHPPTQSPWPPLAAAGLVAPALLLAWGARPSRRRTRRRSRPASPGRRST